MKIELETSPHSYASKDEYATVIKQQMGIELDVDKIKTNPGKRAIAKICLNSLWGKFCQKTNLAQTDFITTAKRWYEILLNDKLNITNCVFLSDDMVQVTYNYKDIFYEDSTSTNIFIAAFTTSHARLVLYDMLDKLGERVVAYDTDNIFDLVNGEDIIPAGSALGEWIDELDGEDIIDWVSTGPNSYYYKTTVDKEVCKIKGFTLNYENSLKLNCHSMREIIDGTESAVIMEYNQITRDTCTKNLVNKRVSKTFRMDYKKRRILTDSEVLNTLPWGF